MKPKSPLPRVKLGANGKVTVEVALRLPAADHTPLEASSLATQLADIATNAWKAKLKMIGSGGEVKDEMRRVYRHVEAILTNLATLGLEIRDHTGDAFDYGLPIRVVTTQPTAEIAKDTVIETIRPTIYWQHQIIQMGEVVIGTPIEKQEPL
jgi:hypothetical protein